MIKFNERDSYEVVREINTGLYGKKVLVNLRAGTKERDYSHYLFKIGPLVLSSSSLERTDRTLTWTTTDPGSLNDGYAAREFDKSKYEVVDEPTLLPMVERLKIETQKRLEERLRMFPND